MVEGSAAERWWRGGVGGVVQLGRDPDSTGRPSKQPLTVDCWSVAQIQALGSDGVFCPSPPPPSPGSFPHCQALSFCACFYYPC